MLCVCVFGFVGQSRQRVWQGRQRFVVRVVGMWRSMLQCSSTSPVLVAKNRLPCYSVHVGKQGSAAGHVERARDDSHARPSCWHRVSSQAKVGVTNGVK